jgi:hypothetical protein
LNAPIIKTLSFSLFISFDTEKEVQTQKQAVEKTFSTAWKKANPVDWLFVIPEL